MTSCGCILLLVCVLCKVVEYLGLGVDQFYNNCRKGALKTFVKKFLFHELRK